MMCEEGVQKCEVRGDVRGCEEYMRRLRWM